MWGNNFHTFQINLQKKELKRTEVSSFEVNVYQKIVFDIV